jgi:hypothetical protein
MCIRTNSEVDLLSKSEKQREWPFSMWLRIRRLVFQLCVCVCQLMEAGGLVGWRVGRVTVSMRESETVKVTICKAPLKHENNKDGMYCTPHGFSLVKSIPLSLSCHEVVSDTLQHLSEP